MTSQGHAPIVKSTIRSISFACSFRNTMSTLSVVSHNFLFFFYCWNAHLPLKTHSTISKIMNCLMTACTAYYIFGSQNALKLAYMHAQLQKLYQGSHLRTSSIGEDGRMKNTPKAKSWLPAWIDLSCNQKYMVHQSLYSLWYCHKCLASSVTERTRWCAHTRLAWQSLSALLLSP